MATIVSAPAYASTMSVPPPLERDQLDGVILYCGAYDVGLVNLEGAFGTFLETVLWSYTGTKAFQNDPAVATISVVHHVTSAFPPAFISSGNADPLTPQSRALANVLTRLGVQVDTLFFEDSYQPPLPHEYQFNLDTEAGQLALARSVVFLSKRSP
jgi:acetyl esterase/lipase